MDAPATILVQGEGSRVEYSTIIVSDSASPTDAIPYYSDRRKKQKTI